MPKERLLTLLLAAIGLLVVLALVTLVPYSDHKGGDLGYSTLCPFAPWSTLTFLVPAGLLWLVRSYVKTQ
jgi:hypothetical protein